jgi:hypothetical protein
MIDLLRGILGYQLRPHRLIADIGFHQLDIARGGMRVDPSPRADDPDNAITEAPEVTRE